MANCDWIIISDYVLEDTHNRLSLIGIFDGLRFPSLPAMHVRLVVTARLSGDPNEKVAVRIDIESAATSKVITSSTTNATLGPAGTHHANSIFLGTRFTEYGVHAVKVSLNGVPAKTGSFVVDRP